MRPQGVLRVIDTRSMTRAELQTALDECAPCYESNQAKIVKAEIDRRAGDENKKSARLGHFVALASIFTGAVMKISPTIASRWPSFRSWMSQIVH